MFTVIGVFALIMLLGTVTYAFFNYTRTGSANIIETGRIVFNSTQGTSMNLNNLFPIDPEETGIMNDATKVGTVTINVTGDTDYSGGIEYKVSAVNVQNTVGSGNNAKSLPISIDVSVTSNTENDPATTLGTSDDYEENYEDVIAVTGRNYFLGLILNENNQIEHAYVCGLYNDVRPFCIEGYYDDTKYTANKGLLQSPELWNDTCNVYKNNEGDSDEYEDTACSLTSMQGGANSMGYVSYGYISGGDCRIYPDGDAHCPLFGG